MTTDVITGEDLEQLFATFKATAWRWEARTTYNEPYEEAPLQLWRDGKPDDFEWIADWLGDIRAATRDGRQFQRVRVYSEPPTEYLRWQARITPLNIEAGEDIRVLTEVQARELALPGDDFWLFDDTRVARMYFGESGFTGAELITEPGTVAQHRAWRDLAWEHAVPYEQYRQP